MTKRFATIFLLLATTLVRGQDGPATPAGTDQLRFPAIEEFERREKVMELRNQTLLHSQEYQQRVREINAVFAAMGRLPKLPGVDEKILLAIEIQRDIAVALEGLKGDQERCRGILELVADIAKDTTMSPEIVRYLKGVRDTATNMLREQTSQSNRLRLAGDNIKTIMAQLPPPPTFENQLGLAMVLVGSGRNAFYINRDAIPLDQLARAFPALGERAVLPQSLNWAESLRFCNWASETESALYRLPSLAHLQAYLAQGGKLAGPVWTHEVDEPKNSEERIMRTRFGIRMATLFDPDQSLGSEPVLAELPFARYPNTVFHMVTPAETGWWFRWNTLKQTLDQ